MKRLPVEDLEHIYQNTKDIWESFREKSIFLTGGTGFFGKWLLESFIYVNEKLSLNARLTTLTRDPESFLHAFPFYNDYSNSVRFVKGDILSFDFNLEDKFQYLIHAATAASESLNKENPLLMMDTITIGTRRVLDFAKRQPIESFLFVSSGAIYGKQPFDVSHINETQSFKIDINNPNSAYAEGKRIAELYCSTYFEKFNLPVKIARCFAFVGPYLPLNTHFAIGNFINNVLNNEDIIIKGDGSTIRSYMYASDLIVWLWIILTRCDSNSPYNVGSDESISIRELAEKIKAISNSTVSVKILGTPIQPEHIDIYCPNVNKSNSINANIKIKLSESINKTIKFYENVK
jgi:nucleoside-diphosphate-sugar epimerase